MCLQKRRYLLLLTQVKACGMSRKKHIENTVHREYGIWGALNKKSMAHREHCTHGDYCTSHGEYVMGRALHTGSTTAHGERCTQRAMHTGSAVPWERCTPRALHKESTAHREHCTWSTVFTGAFT